MDYEEMILSDMLTVIHSQLKKVHDYAVSIATNPKRLTSQAEQDQALLNDLILAERLISKNIKKF